MAATVAAGGSMIVRPVRNHSIRGTDNATLKSYDAGLLAIYASNKTVNDASQAARVVQIWRVSAREIELVIPQELWTLRALVISDPEDSPRRLHQEVRRGAGRAFQR